MGPSSMLMRCVFAAGLSVLGTGAVAVAAPTPAPDGTRELADAAEVYLGAAVQVPAIVDDAAYAELLTANVNMVSTRDELAFSVVQPTRGSYDYTRAETIVDFAVANDMPVRVHDLITPVTPQWVNEMQWSATELTEVLTEHVTTVISHFRDRNPGVITQWDVVSDAVTHDGARRDSIWQRVIGDGWIGVAFDAARAADPDAELFYDDFYDDVSIAQDLAGSGTAAADGASAERTTCDLVPKCVGVQAMIGPLVDAGVPIDGIGFQAHLYSPDPVDFSQFTTWVSELGLRWAITAFDVPLPATEITSEPILEFQASEYAAALEACVGSADCDTFVTWGITDRYSPIPQDTGGAFGGSLWFDVDDQPKPARDALAGVLSAHATVAPEPTTPATSAAGPAGTTPASTTDDSTGTGDEPSSSSGMAIVAVVIGSTVLIAGIVLVARRRRPPDATSP